MPKNALVFIEKLVNIQALRFRPL